MVKVCLIKPLILVVNLAKEDGFRLQSVSSAAAAALAGLLKPKCQPSPYHWKGVRSHFSRDMVIPLAATASKPPTRHISSTG